MLDAVAPGQPSPTFLVQIRHLDGDLSRPALGHGALGHLPEPYMMVCGGPVAQPGSAHEVQSRIDRLCAALSGHASGRTPPSFGDNAASIYPAAVLARLQQIKRRRDPHGVVRSNRPLLPEGGAR